MASPQNHGIGSLQSAQDHLREKEADETEDEGASENDSGEEAEEPIGPGSGTQVYDNSPQTTGKRKVHIYCEATSCIFNRQKNCQADQIEVTVDPQKGMVPSRTMCQTYEQA